MKMFIGVGTDGNIERWWVVVVVFGRENWESIMILLVETKMRVPIELIKGLMIVSVDLVVVE